jgi:hypothetical protein
MKSKILIFIIFFLSAYSCKSTKMTKVFKCNDTVCLERYMGEPNKIIDNDELGKIWEYLDDNGGYSKFYIDNKNKIYDYETSYVIKRASSATIWTIVGGVLVGSFVIGYTAGGG